MELNAWRAQLRKGAAELAVLAEVGRRESYGVELLERIRVEAGLELAEGSIYPLLNRLQKEGKVTSRWVEDAGANHPRKYYSLTQSGAELLAQMLDEWHRFESGMRRVIADGVPHE